MPDGYTPPMQEKLKLASLDEFAEYPVVLKGGEENEIHEFLFDDTVWAVRYAAITNRDWLEGKKVLISSDAFDTVGEEEEFTTQLSRDELKNGLVISLDEPVSRAHQVELYRKFGWLPYWLEEEYYEAPPHPDKVDSQLSPEETTAVDPHLFSTEDVKEYRIASLDGDIGQISDYIVDEEDWVIYYLVADIGELGEDIKRVLVSTEWVQNIARDESRVYVDLDRERIRTSPEFNPSMPITRDDEIVLYDHYGRPRYWVGDQDVTEQHDV